MNNDDSLTSEIIDLFESSSPDSEKLKIFDSSSSESEKLKKFDSSSPKSKLKLRKQWIGENIKKREQEIQKCTDTLGIKFKRFCKVINAAMNDTNIESKYSNIIHQMYANTLVNEEIINAVNKKVCMLKLITLIIRPSINSYGFYTIKYDKNQNQSIYNELNADDIVKLTLGCLTADNDVLNIGIPFAYNYELNEGHQTMLIINVNKIKNKITVEHFDSHGYLSNSDIPQYINIFIKLLFNATINLNKIHFKPSVLTNFAFNVDTMDYEYKSPINICGNTLIQDITFPNRKWAGSCALFSLWYGFARLVNPEETPNETFERMHSIMINSQNPYRAIKNIAKSLFDTLEIVEGSPNNLKPNYRGNSIIKTKKGDVKFIKISPQRHPGQSSTPNSNEKKRKLKFTEEDLPLKKRYKITKHKQKLNKINLTKRSLKINNTMRKNRKLNNKSRKNKSV